MNMTSAAVHCRYDNAIILLLMIKSAFPAGSLENVPTAMGFDYDQYKFAQAVNNILLLRGTDENDQRWGDGDNPFGGHIIKPSLVKYQQISKETADRICQDFELNIFIKSEGRLIDCSKIRKDPGLKDTESISQETYYGRIKRGVTEEGASGGTSTVDTLKGIAPSLNDMKNSNVTEETKTDMMENAKKDEPKSPAEKPNPSDVTESISKKVDTKVETKETDELKTSISIETVTSKTNNKTQDINVETKPIDKSTLTDKPIIGKADNETEAVTSTKITSEAQATTKNIPTQNIMPIITSEKPQKASEIITEKSQNTPIIASNTEKTTNTTRAENNSKTDQQNAKTILTKSEVNVTSYAKGPVATAITPEDNKYKDNKITTPTPKQNVSTTNIGQKETNVTEGQDKLAINRKGKHMDLNAPQIQDPQLPKDKSLANEQIEIGKNPAAKEASQEKNQTVGEAEPKTDKSTKKTAGNSGIIWFLFGGVVIIGAALIGHRMMKKRKQQRQSGSVNKRTAKEPVTETSNTSNREQEMKPLMSDVEAKQNNMNNANDTTIVHEPKNIQESNNVNNEIKQENMQENKSHGEGDKTTEINETNGTQSSNATEDKSLEK